MNRTSLWVREFQLLSPACGSEFVLFRVFTKQAAFKKGKLSEMAL